MRERPPRPTAGGFRVSKDAAAVMLDLAILESENLAAELRKLRIDLVAGKHGGSMSDEDLDILIYGCQDRAFLDAQKRIKGTP